MTNSVHDMGGMHGFGPVEAEPNEPVFHEAWEGRVLAMQRAMGYTRLWTIDGGRASLETLPPVTYLPRHITSAGFSAWRSGWSRIGLVGEDEIKAGHSLRPGPAAQPQADLGRRAEDDEPRQFRAPGRRLRPASRPATGCAPATSTRRRTRGCRAMPAASSARSRRSAAATSFPIRAATGAGDDPQWLYTVVFSARELWGEAADPTVNVSIEAFEPYLDRHERRDRSADFAELIAALPGLPRDEGGPVFREPWEAQAFAMTLALYKRGLFTWPEWAETLGAEIKRAQAAGDPDSGDTYYRHWLAALERLVAEKGIADPATPGALPRRLGPRRRPHAARHADRAAGGGF